MLFCLFGCTLLSALHYFYLLSNSIICHLLSSMLASSTSIWRDPSLPSPRLHISWTTPYLFLPASKSLVVPDLAARNCMITEQRLLKVMMMTKTKTTMRMIDKLQNNNATSFQDRRLRLGPSRLPQRLLASPQVRK